MPWWVYLFPVINAILFVVVFYLIIRNHKKANAYKKESLTITYGKVIGKRQQVRNKFTYYFVTYQFEDKSRHEFSISGPDYGLLVEGDEGTLHYQGDRFIEFSIDN